MSEHLRSQNLHPATSNIGRIRFRKRLIAFFVILWACVEVTSQPVGADVCFTFSADPGEVVLLVTSRGGMVGVHSTFTLYGDGRLEYRHEGIDGTLHEKYDFHLDYSEMEKLLRLAVDHSLLDATEKDIENKVKALRPDGRLPNITDGVVVVFEVTLTSYRTTGGERGKTTNKIRLPEPTYLSRYYNIPELHGLAAILGQMSDYRRLAREHLKGR